MSALHALLNVAPDAVVQVRRVELVDWGRALVFSLRVEEREFTLRFDECREMRWRIYAHESEGDETPLVDFAPGRDAHRSPAQILTGRFGVSLVYGGMSVQEAAVDAQK
jgi:hypothetical protein